MAVVKRVAPASLGKMVGGVYALIGFVMVVLAVPFLLVTAVLDPAGSDMAGIGLGIGLVLVLVMPIMYGLLGLIGGALVAVVYNMLARPLGGIELQLE